FQAQDVASGGGMDLRVLAEVFLEEEEFAAERGEVVETDGAVGGIERHDGAVAGKDGEAIGLDSGCAAAGVLPVGIEAGPGAGREIDVALVAGSVNGGNEHFIAEHE